MQGQQNPDESKKLSPLVGAADSTQAGLWVPMRKVGLGWVIDRPSDTHLVMPQAWPQDRLEEWGIPLHLPCDVLLLPARVLNYCRVNHRPTLGDVLDLWTTMGRAEMLGLRNVGRSSVNALEGLAVALNMGDREAAARWLPLSPDGHGLSLWAGLVQLVGQLDPMQREMLNKRLIEHQSLGRSVAASGLTAERARQIEDELTQRMVRLLDWFSSERDAMLTGWLHRKEWQMPLQAVENVEDRAFIAGALEVCFYKLQPGVKRPRPKITPPRPPPDETLKHFHTKLWLHPDLLVKGVDVESFLQAHVPEAKRQAFSNMLKSKNLKGIRLDRATGRVISKRRNLREVVTSILDHEDAPIPLTKLVALVRETPSHPGIKREQIAKYRSLWKCIDRDFPRDKILWDK